MGENIYYRELTNKYGGRVCWGCGKHGNMLKDEKVYELGFRHSMTTMLLCQKCLNTMNRVLKGVTDNAVV